MNEPPARRAKQGREERTLLTIHPLYVDDGKLTEEDRCTYAYCLEQGDSVASGITLAGNILKIAEQMEREGA